MPPQYQAMIAFAQPAAARSQVWRTLCGILLWAVLTLVVIGLGMIPVIVLLGLDGARDLVNSATVAGTPAGVIGALASFVPMLLALVLMVLILMRRGPLTLIGPARPFFRNFIRVGLPLLALILLMMQLTITGDDVTPHLTMDQLSPWLPAALALLLVQTGTEEVFFRGYLQQQLAARFRSRWLWMVLPSALFGLAHYSGTQPLPIEGLTMLWAMAFGLAAADLTARTGNLGAGLALHFTNNISAILLVGYDGQLGGLALYHVTPASGAASYAYFAQDALGLLVAWLLARVILRR